MQRKALRTIALRSFAPVVVLAAAWQVQAQDANAPYPSMAPLDQYLMERKAEIALARSAAPESISQDAEVMVLGQHGYETVVKGKNGFMCVVERSNDHGPLELTIPIFGSQRAGSDLLQPAGRAIQPSTYSQENRGD